MENHVSFKVYLRKEGDSNEFHEVRRFGIDSDVATSFNYLKEKLMTVFPSLSSASNWSVFWKDEDNDKIQISTDTELVIALTEIDQPIKKLYVVILPDSSTAQDPDQGFTITADIPMTPIGRYGVVMCDGCDKVLSGFRYKCLQCADFDLCSSCEAKQVHAEHLMLRIPYPLSEMKGRLCDCSGKKKGKCCFDNVGRDAHEFGFGSPFYKKHSKRGKRHAGHYRFTEDLLRSACESERLFEHARNMGQQAFRTWVPEGAGMKEARKCESTPNTTKRESSTTESSNTGAKASPSVPSQSGAENASSSAGNQMDGQDIIGEIISNICPMVNNLLNQGGPLVRDILADCFQNATNEINKFSAAGKTDSATDPKNDNDNNHAEKKPENTPTDTTTVNPADESANVKREESEKKTEDTVNSTATVNDSVSGDKDKEPSTPNQNKLNVSDLEKFLKELHKLAIEKSNYDKPSTPTEASAPPDAACESTPKEKKVNFDDGIRVKGIGIEDKEDEGWTMLNEPQHTDVKAENATANNVPNEFSGNKGGAIPKTFSDESTTKKAAEPSAPKTETDSTNGKENTNSKTSNNVPDPFTDSLRRLLAMGFTNEGNWLRELLVNNKGDLAAVIDQLLPSRD